MSRPVPVPLPVVEHPVHPWPLPSSGVVAVASLLPAAAPAPVPAQPELDLGLGPVRRARLRLVTRDGTGLDQVAARFAQLLVDVIAGARGANQLLRWTTAEVYDSLVHRSATLQRAAENAVPSRRLRAHVRSVHLTQPQPEAAELSIHVRHGARSRAIAARMELGLDGRWRCCALELG